MTQKRVLDHLIKIEMDLSWEKGSWALVLEEIEALKNRGAIIEVVGGGLTSDASYYHPKIQMSLRNKKRNETGVEDADINPFDVDYINVHGTSTPLGDIAETKAIKSLFGDHIYNLNISSYKIYDRTSLGKRFGVVETIACVMAVKNNIVPPNNKPYNS